MGSYIGKGQRRAAPSDQSDSSSSQPRGIDQAFRLPKSLQEHSLLESKLPDELLVQVFEYLAPADLIQGPARVCQRWQECSFQPCVWKCKLGLSGFELGELSCTQRWALPQLYSVLSASNLLEDPDRPSLAPGVVWPGICFLGRLMHLLTCSGFCQRVGHALLCTCSMLSVQH